MQTSWLFCLVLYVFVYQLVNLHAIIRSTRSSVKQFAKAPQSTSETHVMCMQQLQLLKLQSYKTGCKCQNGPALFSSYQVSSWVMKAQNFAECCACVICRYNQLTDHEFTCIVQSLRLWAISPQKGSAVVAPVAKLAKRELLTPTEIAMHRLQLKACKLNSKKLNGR